MPEAADLRLIARASGALALMSARYWTTIAPETHRQMRRWQKSAEAIPDPTLRALALTKLSEERFNAQTAPTFATLAPRAQRTRAVEAIVALQTIYDYLDGLTEQPVPDPLRNGRQLSRALTDAVAPHEPRRDDYYRHHPQSEDGGYLDQLVATVKRALAQMPASEAIVEVARTAATRCAEAQVRAHAVPREGTAQLETWASAQAAQDGLSWRELLTGAASAVIALHALIAAAADPRTTPVEAAGISALYMSTCALATLLDGVADSEQDERSGYSQLGYLRYYPDHDLLKTQLVCIARRVTRQARCIRHAGHHLMTAAGVVSYYTSAPNARSSSSRAIVGPVQRELAPLITPTLAFMRTWRLAKRLRETRRLPNPRRRRRRPDR